MSTAHYIRYSSIDGYLSKSALSQNHNTLMQVARNFIKTQTRLIPLNQYVKLRELPN
jgi:hypothetical protein